jgi:hypothetical protein
MLHERDAEIIGVELQGSLARNPAVTDICATLLKYRMFSVAVQQRFYGRYGIARVLFHDAGVTESSGVELGPLPLLAFTGLGEGTNFEASVVA